MQYLGVILTKVGHFREGENYLRRAMSINEMTPKKNFSTIALNKIDLSENLAAQNRFAEAEKILVEARGECIKNLGEENSLANKATDQLVKIYEKQGKPKLAENYK